ncbi:MAG: type I toxin-antitoxin system SymE family toxin [Lachnospiraceae bacterium]|nr:type I toxin-antitoxin system SymE family toxin [Lachnospiraceae bacterium]
MRLQGDWLKETGFSIGDNIQVVCKKNRIVITKAMENAG